MAERQELSTNEDWGSREDAIKLPIYMSVIAYLMLKHRIPRTLPRPDGTVYHYTNSDGLLGIVRSNRFWATDASFLNDPTEGSHALDVARAILTERIPETERELRLITATLQRLSRDETDLFVVSFCREGDLLSQWRGYGSFGMGYALGFALDRLAPPIQVAWLIEVIYDDMHLKSAIDDVLKIYLEHIKTCDVNYIEQISTWFAQVLQFIAQGYKHPSYREEQEVRLIFRRYSQMDSKESAPRPYEVPVSYRSKGSAVIPYLDVPLQYADRVDPSFRLPLTRIILGPSLVSERNERSISGLLRSLGYSNIEILTSRIPFRP